MIELRRLNTSHTKYGAYKIARIIEEHGTAGIFDRLIREDETQDKLDLSQASAVLATNKNEEPAKIWDIARELGPLYLNALTMIGIIFSHEDYISAFTRSEHQSDFNRIIYKQFFFSREEQNNPERKPSDSTTKKFTNLSSSVQNLGFCTESSPVYFKFDIREILELEKLGPLVKDLIERRLKKANWLPSESSLLEEISRLELDRLFGVSFNRLINWLDIDDSDVSLVKVETSKDLEFFLDAGNTSIHEKFKFIAGHKPRKEGEAQAANPRSAYELKLVHNAIQNKLYDSLVEKHGKQYVGTELHTGSGTYIDVAVRHHDGTITIYEIKSNISVKASIRQAISQLLEYAYWPDQEIKVRELVVVSQFKIDLDSEKYLRYLRNEFGIPIKYLRQKI
ncbi:hypothetical protein [Pseudomonas multiresinivorans]|uniref:Uncharacterized protein n=1 Tax=Pseudomonas multiresinivorans TaxID=95301 RepID=A0A7Z3GQH2_9PSED|nr:hypothetical protein [Pseudomonas multiresinivorans]QJP08270.1 hypothetical protein G4G71_10415 [Pseudomonas multiresinivorans]